MRTIDTIVVHCSATPEGRPHTAADIRRWHKAQGWADIGYHWVIRLDGTIERGRPESQAGAHVKGHNARSIGVCYIGGCAADGKTPKDTRTAAQRIALRTLLLQLRGRYARARIVGHHDLDPRKACPCFNVHNEYGNL